MRIVYLEPCQLLDPPAPFRTGAAGRAWIHENGEVESECRVDLSANSTHALLGHGVVDSLNALELAGSLGSGMEVMIPPYQCDAALQILYDADSMTYGASFEFVVDRHEARSGNEETEFRIRIDNREYQRALSRLQFLISSSGREGAIVWIQI